jgi:uncharacterized protein (TIGR01777 family)
MSKILIAGGSGLIGSRLIQMFKQSNIEFVLLSTQKFKCNQLDTHYWNPQKGEYPNLNLGQFSACINFSGQGIFDKRITIKRLSELYDSRIKALKTLKQMFEEQGIQIPQMISASAIGIYPDNTSECLSELSPRANNWVADLVKAWEDAANEVPNTSINLLRIGIVLSNKGGFLDQLTPLSKVGLGAIPGNGRQTCSWIHIDDVCGIILHLLQQKQSGTFNVCAPQVCSLATLQKTLAERLHRKIILPNIPATILKLVFGHKRSQLILADQNISSKAIEATGYSFKYASISDCLIQLYP